MSNYIKPQSPLYNQEKDVYIYPLTTSDQVVMPDGSRLSYAVPAGLEMELLWENASPTSEFAETKITFKDIGATLYLVEFKSYTDEVLGSIAFETGSTAVFSIGYGTDGYNVGAMTLFVRKITESTNNSITFGDGYYTNVHLNWQSWNRIGILPVPFRIYGIKGVKV